MTENEKLRALLAEARVWVCYESQLRARIDAALAEPVEGFRLSEIKDAMRTAQTVEVAIRERDKARAEVERLKVAAEVAASQQGYRERSAYRRGAEAMREAATLVPVERARYWTETSVAEGGLTTADDRAEEAGYIADDIRALPIPEDKS